MKWLLSQKKSNIDPYCVIQSRLNCNTRTLSKSTYARKYLSYSVESLRERKWSQFLFATSEWIALIKIMALNPVCLPTGLRSNFHSFIKGSTTPLSSSANTTARLRRFSSSEIWWWRCCFFLNSSITSAADLNLGLTSMIPVATLARRSMLELSACRDHDEHLLNRRIWLGSMLLSGRFWVRSTTYAGRDVVATWRSWKRLPLSKGIISIPNNTECKTHHRGVTFLNSRNRTLPMVGTRVCKILFGGKKKRD